MKKYLVLSALLLASSFSHAEGFRLISNEIKPGATISNDQVFNGFGCKGSNISPSLKWENAPKGTQSFALMVYDPDAPTGSGWWHWVMFNIPKTINSLAKGAGNPTANKAPQGSIQSRTDFGQAGYGGPCPPTGDKAHRYQFNLFALKIDKIPLDKNAPAAMVGYYLHQNMIEKAVLEANYGR